MEIRRISGGRRMKTCAICGKEITKGVFVEKECIEILNARLRVTAEICKILTADNETLMDENNRMREILTKLKGE